MLSSSAGAYCSYEGWVRDHNEGKDEKEELANLVGEKESVIAELTNKVAEMEAKLNKSEATETVVEAEQEPTITPTEEIVNEWDAFAKSILK